MKKYLFLLHFFFSLCLFSQDDCPYIYSDLSIDSLGNFKYNYSSNPSYNQVTATFPYIERFDRGKWVNADGRICKNKSDFKINCGKVRFHKGINKYRLTCYGCEKSTEFILNSKYSTYDQPVWIVNNEIQGDYDYYEIIDNSGYVILKGKGSDINISSLSKGSYFLYTKKQTLKFTKE